MQYFDIDQNEQWQQWALAAQAGDKKAFNSLLKALVPYIGAVLSKTLSDRDAVNDITQDVLISVHKSLHTYSAERPFKPWLYTIISFRRTDFLRKYYAGKRNKAAPLEHADYYDSGVTNPQHAGELKDIESALQRIPEEQRRVFTLLKVQGYSAEEVAQKMNMNVSAVKVSAHRTAKKLKDMLQ